MIARPLRILSCSVALTALALPGCFVVIDSDTDPNEPTGQAGNQNTGASGGSGGAGAGTGEGGAGAGEGGASAGGDSTGGSGGGGIVAECEAELDRMKGQCENADSPDRACLFEAYKPLCASGEPAAIVASLKCFPAGVCWVFSDPNSAESCLQKSYSAHDKPAAKAMRDALCDACPGAGICTSLTIGFPPEHLGDDTLDAFTACIQSAASCNDAAPCLGEALPDLAACL